MECQHDATWNGDMQDEVVNKGIKERKSKEI